MCCFGNVRGLLIFFTIIIWVWRFHLRYGSMVKPRCFITSLKRKDHTFCNNFRPSIGKISYFPMTIWKWHFYELSIQCSERTFLGPCHINPNLNPLRSPLTLGRIIISYNSYRGCKLYSEGRNVQRENSELYRCWIKY